MKTEFSNLLTLTLDWLAMTFKGETNREKDFCDLYARIAPISDETPRNGYNSATKDGNGVVCMWNADREEMGLHVIFAGSALRNIFERTGISQRDLVKAALYSGGRITRLDIAKDAQNVVCNLGAIWDCIQNKDNKGTARTFSTIEDHKGNRTIYIGSRQSEKFARIYDKRGQLDVKGTTWYRYELETKGMVARSFASLLVSIEDWTGAFDEMAISMLSLEASRDYKAFFTDGTVLVGIPKIEKQSDTETWIEAQVMPAVVKWYAEHRDSEAVALLRRMLDLIERQN